ncbi:hypothetical protein AF2641_11440 [Anoxybacillus flavithermus]|nr:hypothetical protein AF2641_11440 [Anoxybacillus flavithermus]
MFKKGLPILLASMLVASPTFAAKHDEAKHAQKSYLVVKKEEAKKKQGLAKKKEEQKMLKNKLAELNKKLRKIELRLNEISTALETLSTLKEQQVEPTTEEATQPINEQDGTVVTTPEQSTEQPAVTQEQDEAEKQEELDKWIGKLISTSNQLKAVKNEIRALEKKGFTNVGDVQTLKEKVKMLDEKVQQNKKKLLELL